MGAFTTIGTPKGANLAIGATENWTGANKLSGAFTCTYTTGQMIDIRTEVMDFMTGAVIYVTTDTLTVQ